MGSTIPSSGFHVAYRTSCRLLFKLSLFKFRLRTWNITFPPRKHILARVPAFSQCTTALPSKHIMGKRKLLVAGKLSVKREARAHSSNLTASFDSLSTTQGYLLIAMKSLNRGGLLDPTWAELKNTAYYPGCKLQPVSHSVDYSAAHATAHICTTSAILGIV